MVDFFQGDFRKKVPLKELKKLENILINVAPGDPNEFEPDDSGDEDENLRQYENFKKQDGSERYVCNKQQSPQWKKTHHNAKVSKHTYRTNGAKKDSKMEYYRWDEGHSDIEVFDNKARYLGSKDPVTGKMYRPGNMQPKSPLKDII